MYDEFNAKRSNKRAFPSQTFCILHELEDMFPDVLSMTLRRHIEYFKNRGEAIKVVILMNSSKLYKCLPYTFCTLEQHFFPCPDAIIDCIHEKLISLPGHVPTHDYSDIKNGESKKGL